MAGDQYQVSDIDPIFQQLTVVLDAHSVESLYHGTGQLGRGSRASSVCCVLGMDGVVLERTPSLLIATVRKRKLSVPTPGLFFWPGALKAHSGLLSPTPPPVSSDRVWWLLAIRKGRSLWRDSDGRISCPAGQTNAIGVRLDGSNHGMKLLPRPLQILQNSHRIFSAGVIFHACNLSL